MTDHFKINRDKLINNRIYKCEVEKTKYLAVVVLTGSESCVSIRDNIDLSFLAGWKIGGTTGWKIGGTTG